MPPNVGKKDVFRMLDLLEQNETFKYRHKSRHRWVALRHYTEHPT